MAKKQKKHRLELRKEFQQSQARTSSAALRRLKAVRGSNLVP